MIDSERLYSLTIEFLEKHGLSDPLTQKDAYVDHLHTQSGSHSPQLDPVFLNYNTLQPGGSAAAAAAETTIMDASQTGVKKSTSNKFVKVKQNSEQLHDAFMKFISKCFWGQGGRTPSMGGSRPTTAGTHRGRGAATSSSSRSRPSPSSASSDIEPVSDSRRGSLDRRHSVTSGVESTSGETVTTTSSTSKLPTTPSKIKSSKSSRASSSRHRSHILIQHRIKEKHRMTLEEANIVREFLSLFHTTSCKPYETYHQYQQIQQAIPAIASQPVKTESRPTTPSAAPQPTPSPRKMSAAKPRSRASSVRIDDATNVIQQIGTGSIEIFRPPATLADWFLENHGKEPIWNSKAFSVKRYIMLYLKEQAQEEEIQALKRRAANAMRTPAPRRKSSGAGRQADPSAGGDSATTLTSTTRRGGAANIGSVSLSLSGQLKGMFFVNNPETIAPLRKTGFERTPEDIKILFKAMRGIRAFKDLSDFILGQLCSVIRYQTYEGDRAVFRQGDTGTAWYIILSGSCSVQISKTGRIEDSFAVATLSAGSGFGDLALVNDKPRAATILTLMPCEFVIVEKADYNRIIKFIHEKEMKEKIYFLRKIPMFSEWSNTQLRQIGQLITWKKFIPGATIQTQDLRTSDGRTLRIKIGTLGPFDYFGEEAVLYEEDSKDDTVEPIIYAKSTVSAGAPVQTKTADWLQDDNDLERDAVDTHAHRGRGAASKNHGRSKPARVKSKEAKVGTMSNASSITPSVEVAIITTFDATAKLKNTLKMNPLHFKTDADLITLHRNEVRKRIWEREKKNTINRMVKEKLKDPNMTAAKYFEMLQDDRPTWK
eukprot:jgi/Hompol1/6155/HPOL_002610-RA